MKIEETLVELRATPLRVPYRIAGQTFASADLVILRARDEQGRWGYGTASPVPRLTGEDGRTAVEALREAMLPAVEGMDFGEIGAALDRAAAAAPSSKSALAALDIALHDLLARRRGVPLVEMLGGARRRLFTSVTVGIGDPSRMVEDARRHVRAGFRAIKVKIGESLEADYDAVRRIREAIGPHVAVRVDGNEGYSADDAAAMARRLEPLAVELIEQPVKAGDTGALRQAARASAIPIVADEAVKVVDDLAPLAASGAAGGANIKLMKCGGVRAARRLDEALAAAGWRAMVGCMDESCCSIAAAAHFAAAAASVAWIDLDGHFDLADDPFSGGVDLVDGELVLGRLPGLGVTPSGNPA